jgi:hypothetical protein
VVATVQTLPSDLVAFAQPRRSNLRVETSVAMGPCGITGWASEAATGANRPDVGREDCAAVAATVFFDDYIFGSDRIGCCGWHERLVAVMSVVEHGSVDSA